MNLNKAMIIGNLTRDPETRTTPSGQTVTNVGVATNLVWVDTNGERQSKPEYHNIVAWRKLGEICAQYLKKGNKVYVEGRIQTRDWEGQDGVKRYRTEIVAENMIMLDTKGTNLGGPTRVNNYSQPEPPTSEPEIQTGPASDEEEIKVENIPF